MEPNAFVEFLLSTGKSFGMIDKDSGNKKKNVIIRDLISKKESSTKEDTTLTFFGFIQPDEGESGKYHDFSLVFFPTPVNNKYIVSLTVGTDGFKEDYHLAAMPGTRRMFREVLPADETHAPFCKHDFTDIQIPADIKAAKKSTGIDLSKYTPYMSIGCLLDLALDSDRELAKAWIAQYATLRDWGTKDQKKLIKEALGNFGHKVDKDPTERVKELLKSRKYVVLQGPPGVGKTHMALNIVKEYEPFFIQFHAETSYSDFINGIIPDLQADHLKYKKKEGKLVEAIKYAVNNPDKKTLLIIDEINRANLANVLGPVFYLFEQNRVDSDNNRIASDNKVGVEIDGIIYDKLPQNLYVLATMNTADRSIAVVDFALRRRFTWFTVEPRFFVTDNNKIGKDLFNDIKGIFYKYATDEELNLMPGGSYFIAKNEADLAERVEYELMPLIKEYLDQGMLLNAKNELYDLFYRKFNKELYR